jgi:hypothetical protein
MQRCAAKSAIVSYYTYICNSAIERAVLVGRSSSAPAALVRRIDVGAVLK